MPRLLVLDESVPAGLRGILTAFEVKAAPEMELGRNLEREAPGSGGRTKNSLMVLTINHWDTIKADLAAIAAAGDGAGQGTHTVVNVARPPRRRRRPSARSSRTPSAPRCQRPHAVSNTGVAGGARMGDQFCRLGLLAITTIAAEFCSGATDRLDRFRSIGSSEPASRLTIVSRFPTVVIAPPKEQAWDWTMCRAEWPGTIGQQGSSGSAKGGGMEAAERAAAAELISRAVTTQVVAYPG